jgi:AraC family transcriptional regulator
MRSAGAPCLGHVAVERLPAVRWATKVELYRGLVRGRRFLAAQYADGASLRAAAEAACMSPYHFTRLFRVLFCETPHEFLTAVRLHEAKRLLRTTEVALGDVAFRVGFQQASSFSRLFRQRYGMSPREYRAGV